MTRSKKAQGLSLRTIVVAILVLVVLAVIIFIFSDKIGDVRTGFSSCEDKGGQCGVSDCNGPTIKTDDCDAGCCIPLGGDET